MTERLSMCEAITAAASAYTAWGMLDEKTLTLESEGPYVERWATLNGKISNAVVATDADALAALAYCIRPENEDDYATPAILTAVAVYLERRLTPA